MRLHPLLVAIATAAWAAWTAPAASDAHVRNWPQWRGPSSTGASPTAEPPRTWSETNHVRWKVKVPGRGSASPIVWENRVFVHTAIPAGLKAEAPAARADHPPAAAESSAETPGRRRGGGGFPRAGQPTQPCQFALLCLDRQTGRTLWQKVVREEVPHEGHHGSDGTFASASPLTDGQSVFAFFGSRGLHAFDLEGNLRWQKDLGRMRIKMSFGEGASPALIGDRLIVNWDHEGEDFIAAFDPDTGRELWRTARDEETSWATPLGARHEGRLQVVTSATRRIRSYDLDSGQLLWECAGMTANVIPTPVAADGRVYALSGFRGSALLAIRLGRAGDLTGTDAIAWSHKRSTPYVPSPLLHEGRLYFLAGNNATLSCFEAGSGRALFEAERLEGLSGVYASPVAAAGRVYILGRNGVAAVLKASDQLEVLATNRLDDRFDASPALAGRDLFLRGRENLYCLAEP
jgi:outer membrane protein assembly factor BamB